MKWFFALIALSMTQQILAFRLDPMSASIDLKNNQTYFNFVIENESNQPLPVQISLYERGMKDNGEDDLKETNELVAFPDQLIIPPEQKRSVKVSWLGKAKDLKVEKAYRFVAEQLPLDLKKKKNDKSGIKMLLKYVAALYVTPEGAESKVTCEMMNKSFLVCENKGNKHQILSFKSLVIEDQKKKVDFSKEELRSISGENILVGGKRKISLAFKKDLKAVNLPLRINLKLE